MLIRFTEEELVSKLNFTYEEKFETLEEALNRVENDMEDRISTVLSTLGIQNSRKKDRKSLPVHEVVRREKPFVSYFPDMLQSRILKREMVKELLVRGQAKIRFYVDIQPNYDSVGRIKSLNYSINWFEHDYGTM
jgi:hypothetical protein